MSSKTELELARVERDHALFLLKEMLRIRRFEEKAIEMYSLGHIRGFLHLYIGEEAVATGAMHALTRDDNIVATYREHGQALARGIPAGSLMAEMYGKATGCSRGHGGSMHFFDASRRFYGGYAIVGGGLPIAVGLALADKMLARRAVTACFFGDGAVAEGEFHESLNLAALWKLPVLFLCENNLYAMGTALARHQSQTDIHLNQPRGALLISCARAGIHSFWRFAPIDFARIRWPILICTERKQKSKSGRSAIP
jgi:TPP-dependent pyruvate/acetoin dehydrogenase alpha subunit